jgi:predicted neuraminidase
MGPDVSVREFVFGDERPFASCHASTVLPLGGEVVLAAWFGGPYEKHPDVAIWLSRRSAAGWSPPVKVASEPGVAHWNPVLCRSPRGVVHLFYKAGPDVPNWVTRVMSSADGGRSWSAPRELASLDGFPPGPVKDKAIVLADGTWLAPTSRETADAWDAAVTMSRDDGDSWQLGGVVPLDHGSFRGKGVIQPTLWESRPGSVHMLLRSSAGRIYRSDSADGGARWSAASATSLPNNNSGIDLDRLPDGRLALCYNPVEASWGKRTPLVVSISADEGRSWGGTVTLEDEDPPVDEAKIRLDRARRPNEFSYPAIVCYEDALHVSYTWKRERVCYRRMPLAELA